MTGRAPQSAADPLIIPTDDPPPNRPPDAPLCGGCAGLLARVERLERETDRQRRQARDGLLQAAAGLEKARAGLLQAAADEKK